MKEEIALAPVAKRGDIFKVPFSLIRVKEGFNIRKDYGNISELAESIEENGLKVAMRGYKDKEDGLEVFVITDGHRRYKACTLLNDKGVELMIPFILENKGYNDEQRLVDMFITNEGKGLNPLEQAEGVQRLINYGYSEGEIAKKLAKSEGYIKKLNSLNSAPKKFLNLIEKGTISATLAISIIAEGKVEEIMQKLAAGESVQDTQDADGNEIKEVGSTKSGGKITKKDLGEVNSLKEFKKYARNKDEETIDPDVLPCFQFAMKLINNELTAEEIEEFFN